MKTANLLLAGLFIFFAALQYNDPDPLVWIAIYGLVALVCLRAAFERHSILLILAALAICAVELVATFPGFMEWINLGMPNIAETMQAEKPYIEAAREMLGLALCFAVLGYQYFQAKSRRLKAQS